MKKKALNIKLTVKNGLEPFVCPDYLGKFILKKVK